MFQDIKRSFQRKGIWGFTQIKASSHDWAIVKKKDKGQKDKNEVNFVVLGANQLKSKDF